MQGKVLVTGRSGNGIGRAITERSLEDGYEVVNFDINPPGNLREGEHHYAVDMMDRGATEATLAGATATLTMSLLMLRLLANTPAMRLRSAKS